MKIIYLSLLLILACGKNTLSNEGSSINITGQKFDNPHAQELNNLAVEKGQHGQHAEALNIFFEAHQLEPNNPAILSNIGLTYEMMYENEAAIEYYKKSLIVSDSAYLISGCNLGRLYYQMGKYFDGIEILDFVIKNCNEDKLLTSAHINRAFNYLGNKDCSKALLDLNFLKRSNLELKEHTTQINDLEEKIKDCVQ